MHYWTIKRQIMLGLSILISINIVFDLFTSAKISTLKSFVENISANQLHGVYVMSQIQSEESEVYDLMLQHILAATKEETEAYDKRLTETDSKIDNLLDAYQQTSSLEDSERMKLNQVLAARKTFEEAWGPVRELSLDLKNKEAFALFKQKAVPAFNSLKMALKEEIQQNMEIADDAAQKSIAISVATANVVNLSILVMLFACIAIACVIVRSLNRILSRVADTLGEGANQIVAASGQLASASQSLAQGASEQASSLEETSSALGQVGSMTKRNSESAQTAQALARAIIYLTQWSAASLSAPVGTSFDAP